MLLPGTSELIKIFPTHLEKGSEIVEFGVNGSIKKFMAISDLEKNEIIVSGVSSEGPYEYILKGSPVESRARLHLGCHKSQDWLLMKRRADLREFLPFWLRLGQNLPTSIQGELIDMKEKLEAEKWLIEQFSLRFASLSFKTNELEWLKGSSQWIEKLFIRQEQDKLIILPCLPPQLHAGRFLGVSLDGFSVDIEWTKKKIRRLTLSPTKNQEIILVTPPFLKTCRINGKRAPLNQKIKLNIDTQFNIDCFS
jgi:hypothetical protein